MLYSRVVLLLTRRKWGDFWELSTFTNPCDQGTHTPLAPCQADGTNPFQLGSWLPTNFWWIEISASYRLPWHVCRPQHNVHDSSLWCLWLPARVLYSTRWETSSMLEQVPLASSKETTQHQKKSYWLLYWSWRSIEKCSLETNLWSIQTIRILHS